MEKNAKIDVAGHRGMVGSAIVRELERQGYTNIITRTHKELDLTRQDAVEEFFAQEKPEYVFLAAAKAFMYTYRITKFEIIKITRSKNYFTFIKQYSDFFFTNINYFSYIAIIYFIIWHIK